MHDLSNRFGNPHLAYPVIHIAGTNGKGSVAYKTSQAFQTLKNTRNCPQNVGLFSSPHIGTFRERIRINDEMISQAEVVDYSDQIFQCIADHKLDVTFFEIVTMIAFMHYQKSKIDLAVIETGLGGRLDATNICQAELTAITSIGLDHQDQLGHTLREIQNEKQGIIKPQFTKNCVIGPTVDYTQVEDLRETQKSNYQILQPIKKTDNHLTYQDINSKLAQELVSLYLKDKVSQDKIDLALETTKSVNPSCRLQKIQTDSNQPEVYLDVCHNEQGIKSCLDGVKKLMKSEENLKITVVCGFAKTKNVESIMQILKDDSDVKRVFPVTSEGHPRLLTAKELQDQMIKVGQEKFQAPLGSISETLQTVQNDISINQKDDSYDIILVCGSFYIMADVMKALKVEVECDPSF